MQWQRPGRNLAQQQQLQQQESQQQEAGELATQIANLQRQHAALKAGKVAPLKVAVAPPTPAPWAKASAAAKQLPRVAVGSVIPPWKPTPPSCGWSCSCRRHPSWHSQCFSCGAVMPCLPLQQSSAPFQQLPLELLQQPAQPLPVEPAAKRAKVMTAEGDLTPQAMAIDDEKLESALSAVIGMEVIQGPDLKALWNSLTALPTSVPTGPSAKETQRVAVETSLTKALQDQVLTAAMAAPIKQAADDLVASLQKQLEELEASAASTAQEEALPTTFAAADLKRAAAVKSHLAWRASADRKQQLVQDSVDLTAENVRGSIKSLQDQLQEVLAQHSLHADAWRAVNHEIEERHQEAILKLVTVCDSLRRPAALQQQSISTDVTELEVIRAQMVQLSLRLEQQQVLHTQQLRQVHTAAEDKLAGWRRHCEGLVAEGALRKASLPAVSDEMASEEVARRILVAAERKEESAAITDEDAPLGLKKLAEMVNASDTHY